MTRAGKSAVCSRLPFILLGTLGSSDHAVRSDTVSTRGHLAAVNGMDAYAASGLA